MRISLYKTIQDKTDDYRPILIKERGFLYQSDEKGLKSPMEIAKMMQDIFHLELETEEFVYMIGFNNAMKPLGIFQISHGTVNAFLISPREIFLKALILGCSSLVLCHNHTSLVSTTPSREDIQVTQKIKSAGMVIGIPLIDHLILGENYSYTSLKEEGLL